MTQLPEPRRYAEASVTDELVLAACRVARSAALERAGHAAELRASLAQALEQGSDARIRAAFAAAPDAASYRALLDALARVVDGAQGGSDIVARSFALPVVLVAAAPQTVVLPGALAEVEPLRELFERAGALGPTRNFGLSNALCGLESLEALSPGRLVELTRALDLQALGALLPPAPIRVDSGHERTYLRFIVGAGVGAASSPGLTEVAAHIGPWGNECARLIERALAAPGLQLLALPRPPRDLVNAPHAGRFAQLEIAFDLFAANAVRRFRLAVGDPVALVSAHDDADVRVTLSSPFADDMVEGFRWPLHPADDLAQVQRVIEDLFADMRVNDVRIVGYVLPARRSNGALLHPRVDEWDRLAPSTH